MQQTQIIHAFGKIDGAFTLEVLKVSAIPTDITALGAEGMKNIWHNAKLRGRGYSRANEIVSYAEKSVGLTDGMDAGREAVKWYGVRNGLHLQKTNKNLRWYSVH